MQTRHLLPVLLVAASCVGCDLTGNTGGEQQPDAAILPLAVGNTWIMQAVTLHVLVSPQTRTDTIRVVSDTTIDGELWYRVVDSARGRGYYATNREDGFWKWPAPEEPGSGPYLAFRHPAAPGTQYRPTEDESVTVLAVDTTITVDAGSFASTHYASLTERFDIGDTTYDNPYPCDFFYAPTVGYVKEVRPYVTIRNEKPEFVGEEIRTLVEVILR